MLILFCIVYLCVLESVLIATSLLLTDEIVSLRFRSRHAISILNIKVYGGTITVFIFVKQIQTVCS